MNWKKIDGFDNYSVSDTGLVRNDTTGRVLTVFNGSTGYKIVHLRKGGKMKNFKLHRLIASAFISNPQNLKCVNHINGNKQDNRIENLEWCTHSQNNAHSYRTLGRSSYNAIKAMTEAKFKPVLCVETNRAYKSVKNAAEETGALRGNISLCLTGKRVTAGGYHWRYAN